MEYTVETDECRTFWYKKGTNTLHREDGPAIEYANGDKEWYLNGELHREDGPAIEFASGAKWWYLNGKLHREDGPAGEYADGSKSWYRNGKLHREDGPACEYANGAKFWYLNGERHREDGPARELADGDKEWYLNGVRQWRQMNKTQASRLLTLAYHLKNQVPRKQYSQYDYCNNDPNRIGECGTTACALGWTAVIFPRHWKWFGETVPMLKNMTFPDVDRDCMRFFGLNQNECNLLFSDNSCERTPREAARLIERVVDRHGYTYAD